MGLSSSQARLLNLTSRMHQIEYKAAKLEAEKLQMANKSRSVYDEYLLALEKTKVQKKMLSTDGSITYIDATYNNLVAAGYTIKFEGEDKEIVSNATADNYVEAAGNRDYFIALQTGRVTANNQTAPDGVIEIYNASQLMNMSSGKNYRLMSNIDMTGKNWTSKSLSSGKTFDGNGYTISGLNNALFSSVYGTVQNLNVQGNTTTSKALLANYVYNNATLENITVSGSVSSTSDNVGALAGYVSGSNITIQNCSSTANVISTGTNVGGLIGRAYTSTKNSVNISNCSTSGTVEGRSSVGGFIGAAEKVSISNSSSSAKVVSTQAENTTHGADNCSGGFVGQINNSTISNCESKGEVECYGGVIGGFIGLATGNSTISNSNAYGNVTSNVTNFFDATKSPNTAGFISAIAGAEITNCNAFGTVSSTQNENNCAAFVNSNMSGAADSYTDTITNCYAADTHSFATSPNSIDTITEATTPVANTISVTPPTIKTTTQINDAGASEAGALYDRMKANGYDTMVADDPRITYGDDTEWLTNMILAGMAYIYKTEPETSELYQVSVATDTNLQEVSDESLLKKAEAKYEADMLKIDKKDRKYDTDLAALDAERNAIKEEMETLKTVAKENVERTFKLFS